MNYTVCLFSFKARDILKGTVTFTEDVINDDYINKHSACYKKDFSKTNVKCDMVISPEVLKNSDMCDIKHSDALVEQAAQVTFVASNENCDRILNHMNDDNNYHLSNSISKEKHSDYQS